MADYTYHLTHATVAEEVKERLRQVERELELEELVILRQVAMQRVEKERVLAEVSAGHLCLQDINQFLSIIKTGYFYPTAKSIYGLILFLS